MEEQDGRAGAGYDAGYLGVAYVDGVVGESFKHGTAPSGGGGVCASGGIAEFLEFAAWGCTEEAAVFAAELGGAAVADAVAGGGGVQAVGEHEAAGFVESQLL